MESGLEAGAQLEISKNSKSTLISVINRMVVSNQIKVETQDYLIVMVITLEKLFEPLTMILDVVPDGLSVIVTSSKPVIEVISRQEVKITVRIAPI